jgi:hypothetical protein
MKLILIASLLFAFASAAAVSAQERQAKAPRFFELRIYTAHPGKLEDLHRRFREHTNRLFQKHGMELVAYWTPVEGEEAKDTLIYVLVYPDRASRDKSWEAFRNDADWNLAKTESEKNGPLVKQVESKFLAPTDYSPIR